MDAQKRAETHPERYSVSAPAEGIGAATLEERLRAGPLPIEDAVHVGRDVLAALSEGHKAGFVHRAVDPSNVIVSGEGSVERVTLADAGPAQSLSVDPGDGDMSAESVRYMSPEQAGIIGREVDELSDLYSAGAVLFACLVGRPLFSGTTLGEVLREHATVEPDPRAHTSAVPRAVAEVVTRLLAEDPSQRYGSADAALADLEQIAASLGRGEREPTVSIGMKDSRRSLAEPAFVDRQAEMEVLDSQIASARVGAGGLVLLGAESGGGKTRLLDEVARVAEGQGAWVLRGGGVDESAQRPFEVLTAVMSDFGGRAASERGAMELLVTQPSDRGDAISAAFPQIAELLGREPGTAGPEEFGEQRTIEALAALLASFGSADRPAVILLDDCQWADDLTVKLLRRWEDLQQGLRHTIIVAAFRSDEVHGDHPLRRAPSTAAVELRPLEPDEVRTLAESMAGPLPQEALEAVVRLSEGSPFMATAVVRGLFETGALVEDGGGWQVDVTALSEAMASRRAATFLLQRLKALPATTFDLLAAGAVIGKHFDQAEAAALAGRSHDEAIAALEEAKRRHIVWERGQMLAFVHDKLREALLGMLQDDQRSRLHILAAHRLEASDPDACFDLAYHFDAAGDSARALPYATIAAERARSQYAVDVAQQQYEIAERGTSKQDRRTYLGIVEGLGDVLALRGRYVPAQEKLEIARELASDPMERARIDGKLGDLAFKRRDLEAATAALERGLRGLGRRVPRWPVTIFLFATFEIVVQVLHTLLPRLFLGRRSPDGAEVEFVAMRLYSRLAHVYWFVRSPVATFWAHQREMNLAERYPPGPELAQAYSEHAPAMSLIPYYRRGRRYGLRSLEIRRDLGDVWGQGQTLGYLGVLAYCTSRFEEAITHCREAVRLLERTGDRWERNTAEENLGLSFYRLGDLRSAVEVAQRAHAYGVEIDEAMARGISLDVWSRAAAGRIPRELIHTEMAHPTYDVQTNAEVLLAEAVRLLHEQAPEEAVDILQRARTMVRRAGLRQEYVAPVMPWLATALRKRSETMSPWDPRAARALLKHARRVARGARINAVAFTNNRPHALRESGLIAAMMGRTRRARRYLDRSIALAERLNMSYEAARSRHAWAQVGVQHGWPRAAEVLAEAREAIRRIESTSRGAEEIATPSLVDRFDTILDVGRSVASALSPNAVHTATREAAIALLRGERCSVFEVLGDGTVSPLVGDGHPGYGRTLSERALAEGALVILDEQDLESDEAVVQAGIRSALAVPILVRGRPSAILYAESRKLANLFGGDGHRLATFVATLAGAALENAEGFAEIRDLTRSLEGRVRERTKELDESNQRLRRLDHLKTDFLAMTAHDLRNPITVISGFTEMLREAWPELDDEERRQMVDRISVNTKRLDEFIENLLHFAKLESGELSYDARPFDLSALARKTVDEMRAVGAPDRLRIAIEPDLPNALGDEHRSWQVLTNLLSNAMKFSDADEPVEVTVRRVDDELEVSVTDHGPGIAEEDRERIFERFGRADTQGRARGTGLGLYITKAIVDAQGGRIWFDTSTGEGTTFTYTIPVAGPVAGPVEAGGV